MLKLLKISLSVSLLTSCAGGLVYPPPQTGAGVGFGAGAASVKVFEELKDKLEPVYKLGLLPQALCARHDEIPLLEPQIYCFVVPCVFEESDPLLCQTNFSEKEFWEIVGTVELLDTSELRVQQIESYCKRNPTQCVKHIAKFKDKVLLLTEEK